MMKKLERLLTDPSGLTKWEAFLAFCEGCLAMAMGLSITVAIAFVGKLVVTAIYGPG